MCLLKDIALKSNPSIRDTLLQQGFRNWMGSEDNLIQARNANLNYFTNRRILTKNELSQVCPRGDFGV